MKNSSLLNFAIKDLDCSSTGNLHDHLKRSQSPQIESQENVFKIRSGSSKSIRSRLENQENKRGGTPVQQSVSKLFTEKDKILKKTSISNDVFIEIIEILSCQIIKHKCVDKEFKGKILELIEKNEPLKEIKSFIHLTEIDEENNNGELLRNKVRKKNCLAKLGTRIKLKTPIIMNKKIKKTTGTLNIRISASGRKEEKVDNKFLVKESGELPQPPIIRESLENTTQIQPDPNFEKKVLINSSLSEENYSKDTPKAKKIPLENINIKTVMQKIEIKEKCEKANIPETISRNFSIPSPQAPISDRESPAKRSQNRALKGSRPPLLDFSKNKILANTSTPSISSKISSPQLSPTPKTEEFSKIHDTFFTDIPKTPIKMQLDPNEEKKKFVPEPNTKISELNEEKQGNPKNKPPDFLLLLPLNSCDYEKKNTEIFPSNINIINPTTSLDQTDPKTNSEFTLSFCKKSTSNNLLEPEKSIYQNTPRYFNQIEDQDSSFIENQNNKSESIIGSNSPKSILPPPPLIPKPDQYPLVSKPDQYPLVPKLDLPTPLLIPKPVQYPLVLKPDLPPPLIPKQAQFPIVPNPALKYPPVITVPVQYPLVPKPVLPPPHLMSNPLQNSNTELYQYQNPSSLISFNNWPNQYQNPPSVRAQNFPVSNLVGNNQNFNGPFTEFPYNNEPGTYNPNTQPDFYNNKFSIPPPPPLYASPELYKDQISPVPQVPQFEKPQIYQHSKYNPDGIPETCNQYKNDDKFHIPPPISSPNFSTNNDKGAYFVPFPLPPTIIQQPQILRPPPLPGENFSSSKHYNPQTPTPLLHQNPPLIPKPIAYNPNNQLPHESNFDYQHDNPPYPEPNYVYFTNQLEKEKELKKRQDLAYSQRDYRQKLCLVCKEFKDRETFEVVLCEEKYGNCQVCSFCRKKMKEKCAVCYREYSSYDREILDLM